MTRDLLLFSLGDTTFGVWEEEISSVAAARPLHRLPLSPPAVAGMAIIEDKGATIFDLGACLGVATNGTHQASRFLLLNSSEGVIGFCIPGAIETRSCSPDAVTDMPKAVRTDVIGTCLVLNGTVVPLIHIHRLQDRLMQGILDVPEPEPSTPGGTGGTSLRLATIGGASFGVRSEADFALVPAGTKVTALPYAGGTVEGVVLHENAVAPVVTIRERLGLRGPTGSGGLLVVRISGESYAIAVDADRGTPAAGADSVLPLPPLARTAGIREAIVQGQEVAPVLDASAIVSSSVTDVEDGDLASRYTAGSEFSGRFQQAEVEVAEFSLLGNRHALPKEEVKEVLAPVPYRSLPGVPEIVIGVAVSEGRLLPVLDLATIFGRRTARGPAARMLRIVNGDFEAFVLVEAAGSIRPLERDLQRKVPIVLPYEVLYGCYLDGRAVRLIMNVLALAVHFERTEIRELVAGLAPPAEPPAEEKAAVGEPLPVSPVEPAAAEEVLSPAGLGEVKAQDEGSQTVAPEDIEAEPQETSADAVSSRSSGTSKFGKTIASAAAHERAQEREARRQRQKADAELKEESKRREEEAERAREAQAEAEAAAALQEAEERARVEAEQARRQEEAEAKAREAEEAARLQREEEEKKAAETGARLEAEQAAAEAARQRAEAEAKAKEAEETARLQREEEEKKAAEAAARLEAEQAAAEAARQRAEAEAKAKEAQEAVRRQREEEERRSAEAARQAEEKERQEREAADAAVRRQRERDTERFREVVEREIGTGTAGTTVPADRPPARSHRSITIAAIIAAMLLLLLYWVGGPPKQKGEKTATVPPPSQTATEQAIKAPPHRMTVEQAAKAPPHQVTEEKETEAPLVLDVPATMPKPDVIVYTVVKGDTLWDISERFTGDPFNYPRVAKDNSIATPDLIFPGQRIRLRQELQKDTEGRTTSP